MVQAQYPLRDLRASVFQIKYDFPCSETQRHGGRRVRLVPDALGMDVALSLLVYLFLRDL